MNPMQCCRAALIVSLLLWPGSLLADTWQLNHQESDLNQFINQVADITGKTFVVDPRVRGQVTVISDEELTEDEVYEVFLAVLRMQGFTTDEQGNEVHVIPVNDAKQITGPVIEGDLAQSRRLVTRVITLDNVSAMELIPILRPIGASYGHMSGIPSANAILMVDHSGNIRRIEQILNTLDVATESEIRMINLEHAWVGEILELLQALVPDEISGGSAEDGIEGNLRVVADERSNRLILRGNNDVLDYVEDLVTELDVERQEDRGNTEVIFLDNGDAVRMAELLRGLEADNEGSESEPQGPQVSILADEELNALIVRADSDEMAELKSIIDQLDIPRAQVLIEAAIVEVSGSLSQQFGMQSGLLNQGEDTAPALIGNNITSSGAEAVGNVLSGAPPLNLLGEGGLLAGGAASAGNVTFAAIIEALENQSNTNLLSTPYVMTMDNSEARLVVGETVPFRRTDPSDDNPFTITRENVATEITVRPNIQQDDTIRLEINQKTEELIGAASLESRTSTREIDTKVIVGNQETIILGGMVKDRVIDSERKVPLLGDLPLIGGLFRSTTSEFEKVNLLVVIRPSIARDRTTEQARERYLGIWELRFGAEGSELEAVVSPPSFDQLYRGIQTIEEDDGDEQ